MKWSGPGGVNLIYSCGRDLLSTLHRAEVLYGYGYWGYIRVSRLKSKSSSSSHTGGSVQGRAALMYSMVYIKEYILVIEHRAPPSVFHRCAHPTVQCKQDISEVHTDTI